jgi:uncharacterized RDD family membrane protein YckC
VAAGVDLGLLLAGYSLISSGLATWIPGVFGAHRSVVTLIVLCAVGVITGGAIFAAFWALVGQTPGMRFLAIRVIHDGSREITFGCAVRRVLGLIVSLLPLGLGFLAILRDPYRRAWYDRWTGTEVIYDVVARAAPHAGDGPSSAAAARHRPRRT